MENFSQLNKPTNPEKEVGSIISHAFENYKGVLLYAVIAFILTSIISWLFQTLLGLDEVITPDMMKDISEGKHVNFWEIPNFSLTIGLSGLIGVLLYPVYAGILYITHKVNTNQPVQFSDLFIGYKQNTLNLLLYGIISGILIGIGFVLCIIPGFLLLALFFIGMPIVFFENKGPIEALQKAFEVSKPHIWTMVGVSLLSLLISFAGVLLCGIGIVFTAMFTYTAMYSAYCALCGTPYEVKS